MFSSGLDCAVRLIGISAASVTSDLNLGTVVPFFAPSARFTLFFHDSTTPTIRLASVSSGTRQAFLARGSRGIAARMSSNSSSSFTKTSIFAVLLSSSSLTLVHQRRALISPIRSWCSSIFTGMSSASVRSDSRLVRVADSPAVNAPRTRLIQSSAVSTTCSISFRSFMSTFIVVTSFSKFFIVPNSTFSMSALFRVRFCRGTALRTRSTQTSACLSLACSCVRRAGKPTGRDSPLAIISRSCLRSGVFFTAASAPTRHVLILVARSSRACASLKSTPVALTSRCSSSSLANGIFGAASSPLWWPRRRFDGSSSRIRTWRDSAEKRRALSCTNSG
mmetsp:Transcript_26316/g.70211  ORF Transcript_26316/g.70211 Transcript_26316/m.70211 type:complete len:335 (+) Transcript_26316:725-1729(+)